MLQKRFVLYDYHFETPVDAKYDNSDNNYEPIEVDIPLYTNGEIRLMMKNAEYSTDLPTVFFDIQNSASQGSSDVDS